MIVNRESEIIIWLCFCLSQLIHTYLDVGRTDAVEITTTSFCDTQTSPANLDQRHDEGRTDNLMYHTIPSLKTDAFNESPVEINVGQENVQSLEDQYEEPTNITKVHDFGYILSEAHSHSETNYLYQNATCAEDEFGYLVPLTSY